MVSALDRKLARDLWRLRGQLIAVVLVIACGVGTFVTTRGMYESLVQARAEYYARYRFAEVFAYVKRAPEALLREIAAMPEAARVASDISLEVTLDVPGLAEPATAQLVSLPDRGRPALNDVHIERGRYLQPGARDEVLVSEAFAKANGLQPGSVLSAVINGRWQKLRVVGIAISPEFIFVLRPASGLPDNRRYGILWMGRSAVAYAYDMVGAFNRLALGLVHGAQQARVIQSLDSMLARYGAIGAFGRDEHLSHKVVSDEITQQKVYGAVVAGIFLAVAAFIINIVLSRLVATQRDQIGLLKAFGYANSEIAWHYLKLVLIIIAAGSACAVPVAAWLGGEFASLYRDSFHFPSLEWHFSAGAFALGGGAALLAAAVGAFTAVGAAVRLPPAEAMRPEQPQRFRPGWIERAGFQRWLSISLRMIVRNLERRPWKAVLSIVGIALAVAILVTGRYGIDAIDRILEVQFRLAQREDIDIDLANPRAAGALHEMKRLPGVLHAEPFRFASARFRVGHRTRRGGILALPQDGDLRRVVDIERRAIALPHEGLMLSEKLAQVLGVAIGDAVNVEFLEGERRVVAVPVTALVDDPVGIGAYMTMASLNALLRQDAGTLSGGYLAVDASRRETLYRHLKALPLVRGVSAKDAMLASFRDVIARSLRLQTAINIVFATIIALGVVYNSVRIALSERAHELASLRVLGFTHREIAAMLLGEQALLTLAALPAGFAVGFAIVYAVVSAMNRIETFRLPLFVALQAFAFAAIVVMLAAALSGLLIWGRLKRLDLVAVLKTRE